VTAAATISSPPPAAGCLVNDIGASQSAELKCYKIRVRKFDNQNVVISGSVPASSTLQVLADKLVDLGHAAAGTFSIALPPFLGRPPTVFEPNDFTVSMESCGIFAVSALSISLQKFCDASSSASLSSGRQLGSVPPLPHKVPVPPDFQRHIQSHAIRRAAELALPRCQELWGVKRFGQGTLDEEKKRCIEYFVVEDSEMSQLLLNIWNGNTWPDASEPA
jgi:hypothetical protein